MLARADNELNTILKGVEDRYNHAKTMQVQFVEGYTAQGRPHRPESGTLTLRKPGRMRWDYTQPEGKLFISDGKTVWLYMPEEHRVERAPLKESEDMRAPLAFLLGRLDFSKEFRDLQLETDGQDKVITAFAKSDRLPYDKIVMVVAPDYEIRRLTITGVDQSVLTFTFAAEKMNPKLNDSSFHFHMPADAALAETEGR
jgi:outer membrane lipoprotein carrier protein